MISSTRVVQYHRENFDNALGRMMGGSTPGTSSNRKSRPSRACTNISPHKAHIGKQLAKVVAVCIVYSDMPVYCWKIILMTKTLSDQFRTIAVTVAAKPGHGLGETTHSVHPRSDLMLP